MQKIKFCLIFILLITGCSPVKRHQRIVEKYPFVHEQDTIIMRDTIRVEIPKIEVDSVFLTKNLTDTVTIIKDRLKIKMYTVHDSIYVHGECDTIKIEKIIERKIPIRYYEKSPSWMKNWKVWIWFVLLFILGMFTIYRVTKK